MRLAAPVLSGPASVEEVSSDLWTGSKKKTVPSKAQRRALLCRAEAPRPTWVSEAWAAQSSEETGVRAGSPCRWLRSES